MGKSFVLYTEVHVEGDLVNCNYLIKGQCWAQPFAERGKMKAGNYESVGADIEFYKPTEDDQRRFCANTGREGFRMCPRAGTYHEYLRAKGLEKEETRQT